jgi:hypothetical protein
MKNTGMHRQPPETSSHTPPSPCRWRLLVLSESGNLLTTCSLASLHALISDPPLWVLNIVSGTRPASTHAHGWRQQKPLQRILATLWPPSTPACWRWATVPEAPPRAYPQPPLTRARWRVASLGRACRRWAATLEACSSAVVGGGRCLLRCVLGGTRPPSRRARRRRQMPPPRPCTRSPPTHAQRRGTWPPRCMIGGVWPAPTCTCRRWQQKPPLTLARWRRWSWKPPPYACWPDNGGFIPAWFFGTTRCGPTPLVVVMREKREEGIVWIRTMREQLR